MSGRELPTVPTGAIRVMKTTTTIHGKTFSCMAIQYPNCVRCGSDINDKDYHWCINCFNLWQDNGNCFPEDKGPKECMITDDDEKEFIAPIAPGPIDAYRGSGKAIVAEPKAITKPKVITEPKVITDWDFPSLYPSMEYIKSTECKFKCIPHQIGKGNTCICDDKHEKLNKRLTEVKDKLAAFNGSQYVGFGKFKTCKWENMCRDKDRRSWSEWYLKNGKKDLFYNYLVLLKMEDDLLSNICSIERPFYD